MSQNKRSCSVCLFVLPLKGKDDFFPLGYLVPAVESSPLLQGWTLYIQCMQLSKTKREKKENQDACDIYL